MQSFIGQYLAQTLLNLVFGDTAYTVPGTLYVGLSTTTITRSGGSVSGVTEPSGGGYARVAVTNNTTNWSNATAATPSVKANAVAITFPQATASWGTVTDMFIADAATGGNILWFGKLTTSQTDTFSGNGTTTSFTTTKSVVGPADSIVVAVGGTTQTSGYTVTYDPNSDGTATATITFSTAPASGTNNVTITYQTPNPQTVSTGNTLSFAANALQLEV
jgi:hypothetical protein